MRTKHFNLQLLFVLLCFCSTVLSASDLTDRLKTIQAISQIQPIESKCFSEKYVIKFRHPVDYNDPEGMTFEQRVVIGHVGFDRPTVIVTEGYGIIQPRIGINLDITYKTLFTQMKTANLQF